MYFYLSWSDWKFAVNFDFFLVQAAMQMLLAISEFQVKKGTCMSPHIHGYMK